jgi:sugar phosphate isomerase/epimerase
MNIRIGQDVKLPSELRPVKGAIDHDPFEALKRAHAAGLDGVLFRTLYELSPTLDRGVLRELRAEAEVLACYIEVGVGKVNPYMTLELPEVRALGDGSYLAGMTRMIEAAADLGWRELWSAMANYKGSLPGLLANDRYRTDVSWADQLAATESLLRRLAPVLRHHGAHLNLETHEEVTTFELLTLIEAVGEDVLGVTLDTANVVIHAEDPLAAARRVAPHTRMTHLRDVALFATEQGLTRYLAPCGQGVIDWGELLAVLAEAGAAPNLTIEVGAGRAQPPMHAFLHDPRWLASHPSVAPGELAVLYRRALRYQERVQTEGLPDLAAYQAGIQETRESFVSASAATLRAAAVAAGPVSRD